MQKKKNFCDRKMKLENTMWIGPTLSFVPYTRKAKEDLLDPTPIPSRRNKKR